LGNVRTVLRKEINPPATIVKQFDYAPFGAVIPLLGNVNRIKFIGKEKDKESNYADHGVRKYDDEIGRFTSIDPLWEKYYSLTPYQYAGNNPVIAKDANGKDYDVSIEGKNIIISATYYANESNIGSLQGDLDYYNNMTGLKYTQNGTEYNVVFKLVAMLAQVPYSKLNQDVSNFDNNGNMKEPLTNSNTYETTTSLDNTNAAGTTSKNIIKILDIYSNHETVGKHEIAHSLGIPHSLTGLMTESINDSKHSQTLWPAQIYQIITNAINGVIPPTNSGLGKGTFKNRWGIYGKNLENTKI